MSQSTPTGGLHRSSFARFASTVARDMREPVTRKADSTTERVLQAGFDEFMDFGFRRTTIDNVARRAGVARMTVYRRFRSKEALAEAILARETVALMRAVGNLVDRSSSFEERWVEGFAMTIKIAREHKLLQRLLVSDAEDTLVALTIRARPVIALASGFLSAFIRHHRPDIGLGDAEWAAESVLRLIQSFILTPSRVVKVDDVQELREYAQKQVLPLLPARST